MGCPSVNDGGLEERILEVRRRDRRYACNAYYFVLDALDYTMVKLGRERKEGDSRHVGGRELLDGIREFAADQFGPMANVVFNQWGLNGTEDFGEIVFNLIDTGLLSRRDEDSRLDFSDGYDFERVFDEMFQSRLQALRQRAWAE
jgi:uncharacterized repeat protein (TIGR04138 family)